MGKRREPQRRCEAPGCGKFFTPYRRWQRYCPGGTCKQRAYRGRRLELADKGIEALAFQLRRLDPDGLYLIGLTGPSVGRWHERGPGELMRDWEVGGETIAGALAAAVERIAADG